MKVYTASGWIAASSASVATLATFEFVATSGQTVFTGADANGATLSYVAPALIVTLNGVRLRPGDDYTATNGTSITLVSAAALNDELVVDAFGAFLVANTVDLSTAQTIGGVKTFSSNAIFNGNVGIGKTPGTSILDIAGEGQTGSNNMYLTWSTTSSGYGSTFNLRKSNGTKSSPTAVANGDQVGVLVFAGYDGSNYQNTAYIESRVDGTPGANDMPGRMVFFTTPDGSTSPTERMRITSTGVVQVGNNNGTGEVFAQNTVKVWGSIVGSNGSMYNSFGVSSSSKVSTGVYQINFSRTLSSSRFGMGCAGYGGNYISGGAESTTGTRVYVFNDAGTATDADAQFLIAGGS
jgi:hypothetical protein